LLILAKSVTLNNAIQKGVNIMFKSLFANDSLRVVAKAKKTETRGRKTLSKRQKVLNLLSKGESVTWKTLRNRFDLYITT
jgi:predicted HTH transcriptional regulator